ncbi:cell division cycle-associated 7-like protein [Brienomyrus brachyistius]|uniref:cell division cycle-associated 7-like protein n=1 Tax=Brienomyrus brachyistius TaxID=42636 RepID=UPI0020B418B4|nr:cell division cycle-associated 7-like protein [Brienomyrus brachyistius]
MEVLCFRSKYITEELVRIFSEETDSEEEFEGFGWDGSPRLNCWIKGVSESTEDTGFYSEGESKNPVGRSPPGLRVAFRFPSKKRPARQKHGSDSDPQDSDGAWAEVESARVALKPKLGGRGEALGPYVRAELGDDNADSEFQCKRARNIEENKAMLAKLFADMNSVPELSPQKTPTKKKTRRKKLSSNGMIERRNPSRRARPPEHFGVEEVLDSTTKLSAFDRLDTKSLLEAGGRWPRPHGVRRSSRNRHLLRDVVDITKEELENVAQAAKDKILDKDHGTTCHQCRQKTLDTKTVCRSASCKGVRGQFCGPCLRNRYGEDVRAALLDPAWKCPLCRGVCNCSLCRKREGRCATGALVRMAKFYGHSSVREYLESLQKQLS